MALIGFELFHATLHLQVLFGLSTHYTVEGLKNNGSYFMFDAATVVSSCIFILITMNRRRRSQKNMQLRRWLIFTNMLMHFALHMYFIVNWQSNDIFWVNAIRDWSSETFFHARHIKHGKAVGALNFMGTSFDIFVHLFMVSQLIVF